VKSGALGRDAKGARNANGTILDSMIVPDDDCGFLYWKGTDFRRPLESFDRVAILFPRGATQIDLRIALNSKKPATRIDTSRFAVLPAGTLHEILAKSSICELLILLPSAALLERTREAYSIPIAKMREFASAPRFLHRANWLSEVHHRYFFERFVCRKANTIATQFCEMEIAKEAYFISAQAEADRGRVPLIFDEDTLTKRAVAFIESRLFEPLTLDEIAAHIGASRSTLLRAFRTHLGKAPNGFIRDRRLDEARGLLQTGRFAVGEAGRTVGYENFSAFSQAFRKRFGISPSEAITAQVD
jgi:AraC-like DNA-binding protein